jgi:hypothetical protein
MGSGLERCCEPFYSKRRAGCFYQTTMPTMKHIVRILVFVQAIGNSSNKKTKTTFWEFVFYYPYNTCRFAAVF